MIRNKHILFTFRLTVGGIFTWAGLLKIIDPHGFAQSIANYNIFPQGMSLFLALVLPWIEVICGIFLISGIFRKASTIIISGSLAIFLILIAVSILRGLDIDCGCFGNLGRKVDYKLILLDSLLLFFSLNIVFYEYRYRITHD